MCIRDSDQDGRYQHKEAGGKPRRSGKYPADVRDVRPAHNLLRGPVSYTHLLRIKIKDVQKILVFKIVICIAHRPGKDGICDADSGSSLKEMCIRDSNIRSRS